MSIIESIPENLTYSSASPSYGSTYDGWKSLLKTATKSVDIASFYWSLRGHGNISDSTDKQVHNVMAQQNLSPREPLCYCFREQTYLIL